MKGVSDRIKLLIEEGVRELPDLFENILRESGKAVLDYVEEEGLIRSRISDWTEQLTAALHLEEWLKKENFVKEEEAARTQLRELFSGQEETSKGNWEDADGMSLFELAKDWENKGILALVAPGAEAERVLEGEDLPSFQAGIIEEIQGTDPVTAVMFQEYLFSYLDSFQDQTGCCDLEYILGSSSSDRENLKAVAKELLLLREGLNLAYLYTDPERRQEAKTMAQAITGASGLLVLYPVAELLILSIWAFAEAIVDVRGLMAGEKVPFWKSSQSFHTSLQGLLSSGLSEGEGGQGGFDYETYLRMLLFLRDPAIKRLRAMDVIQWNMQKEYPEFRFSRCISRVQMTLFYKASPIFLSWGGIYHMETRTSYEY